MSFHTGCPLAATSGSAARFVSLRLHCSHESTHELAIHLRRDCVDINILAGEEFTGVFDAVDSGGFKVDVHKASGGKLAAIFVLFECAGNATNPQQDVFA